MIEYYKKYEPLFGGWRISRLIGKGSFGEVYEIERTNFGTLYKAALKVIAIPVEESELQELLASGMGALETEQYIKQSAKDIVNEFVLMSKLKGNTNIVSYEDHQVIEREDKLGWDIMMKMELLEPIKQHIKQNGFTKKELIKLGIDLCTALELCEKHNIIHRDIKPENIFVSPNGDFKLGDFGIARNIEKSTFLLSKKGTYTYMAPEVYKGEQYTNIVDIYSLGIVMYKFINCNRIPFMPPYPQAIVYTDRENALTKRVSGEAFPLPEGIKEGKLVDIILKACQFDKDKRYRDATEMKNDLIKLLDIEEDLVILAPIAEESVSNNKQEIKNVDVVLAQENQQQLREQEEEKEEIEKTLLIDREELAVDSVTKLAKRPPNKKLKSIIIGSLVITILGITSIRYTILNKDSRDSKQGMTDAYISQQQEAQQEVQGKEQQATQQEAQGKAQQQTQEEIKQAGEAAQPIMAEKPKEVQKEEVKTEKVEKQVPEVPKQEVSVQKTPAKTQAPTKSSAPAKTQAPTKSSSPTKTPAPAKTQETTKSSAPTKPAASTKPPEIYMEFE